MHFILRINSFADIERHCPHDHGARATFFQVIENILPGAQNVLPFLSIFENERKKFVGAAP
jgi:hypothetical protein